MKAYAVTDVGIQRAVNQDYVYYTTESIGNLPNLFLVADGMGGHKAGDMASKFTVEHFMQLIANSEQKDVITLLSENISIVNTQLLKKATESADYKGMGTTFVAATIQGDVLRVANVGDSRLYVVDNDIRQITRDHSYVEELVLRGKINREQARTHEKKNYITRAIGGEPHVEPELFAVDLHAGEKILMCTDGLSNMIEDNEILKIISRSKSIEEAVDTLIVTANAHGGKDNISAMIIDPEIER